MKSIACEPCARRKVRCDREEPCANCRRRKRDHCTYPETLPSDRIKKLESLVRYLGGDPEDDTDEGVRTHTDQPPAKRRAQEDTSCFAGGKSSDPVLSEEDGQSYYLESYVEILVLLSGLKIVDAHGTAGSAGISLTMQAIKQRQRIPSPRLVNLMPCKVW